jgi:hypothetical protein
MQLFFYQFSGIKIAVKLFHPFIRQNPQSAIIQLDKFAFVPNRFMGMF